MSEISYIHGFDQAEQKRLLEQAAFLAPKVYEGFDFRKVKKLLEIGCGVGAQTKILAQKNAKMHITSVDISENQIATAQRNLASLIKKGRVDLIHLTKETAVDDKAFDAVFLCWVLEHVTLPESVLEQAHRALKKGGTIYLSEVFSTSVRIYPRAPKFEKFWTLLCDTQSKYGGDPDVGVRVPSLLKKMKFKNIDSKVRIFSFDSFDKKFATKGHAYWRNLARSSVPQLIKEGLVTESFVDEAFQEFDELLKKSEFSFFCGWVQATATKG